jgi:hypothetical protein
MTLGDVAMLALVLLAFAAFAGLTWLCQRLAG